MSLPSEGSFSRGASFGRHTSFKTGVDSKTGTRRRSSFFDETMKPRESIDLSPDERSKLNEAFAAAVGERTGIATTAELTHVLELINETATQEETQALFQSVDKERDGVLGLDQVVQFLERRKLEQRASTFADSDLLHTFVAFGGNSDMTGTVDLSVISNLLEDFELNFSLPNDKGALGGVQDNVENCPVDFLTFRKTFGQLLRG